MAEKNFIKKIATVIGTQKAGENGQAYLEPNGAIRMVWDTSKIEVTFIDHETFERWVCPEWNTCIESVKYLTQDITVRYSPKMGFNVILPDGKLASGATIHAAFADALEKLTGMNVEFTAAAISKIRMGEQS